MINCSLGEIEAKFAQIIWENEPISSGELVRLAEARLGWKKSTTYTVLKRLCEKGLFCNERGDVRAAVSQEEFSTRRSEQFVNEAFDGSLPRFLTALSRGKKLSGEEVDALLKFIDENSESGSRG
ncbi:MAG: BlaI/MecI/CopY family transcriptional regulator [Clostridia bacterium]|nr:BlaI/MecI/CopY family transcriptional regulator [Clostridia bacterium]MCR4904675.1 BlaI/MecI/CopY family transcriptional regulator [Clostridiales bacterium]